MLGHLGSFVGDSGGGGSGTRGLGRTLPYMGSRGKGINMEVSMAKAGH